MTVFLLREDALSLRSVRVHSSCARLVASRLGVSMTRRGLTRALERKSRLSCAISRASPHSAHHQTLVAFPLVRACAILSFFWLLFLAEQLLCFWGRLLRARVRCFAVRRHRTVRSRLRAPAAFPHRSPHVNVTAFNASDKLSSALMSAGAATSITSL